MYSSENFIDSLCFDQHSLSEEYLLQENIIIDKISKKLSDISVINNLKYAYSKNQKTLKKILIDNGIDMRMYKKFVDHIVKIFKEDYRKGITPKSMNKTVSRAYNWIMSQKEQIIQNIKTEMKKNPNQDIEFPEAVALALIMTFACAIINEVADVVLSTLFGPKIGKLLTSCVFGPMNEEFLKYIAIKTGYPFTITGIFAGIEAFTYIRKFMRTIKHVGFILQYAAYRLIGVAVHFATLIVSKYFHEKDSPALGYTLGVIIHGLFNLLVTMNNNFLGMDAFGEKVYRHYVGSNKNKEKA